MKRVWMLIAMMFASLALVGCVEEDEIASAVEVFCTDNPEALVCQNPEATRDAVVADMFNTILMEFISGENTDFCTDYFDDSTLIDTCENDKWSLVPDDVTSLSDDLVVQALPTTNEFEVLTERADGTPAYRFIVRVTERDGLLRFNRFDFETRDTEDITTFDDMDIKMLMNTMINDQDDAMAYCDTYFTTQGKTDCLADVVQPAYFMYNPVVTHISGATYTYAVKTYDGYDELIYTIDLVLDASDHLKIDGISVEHRPAYNTLAHAHELVSDNLVYQFNRVGGGTYNACSYVHDDGTTDCRDRLNAFTGETMTIVEYGESATPGRFSFTLGFDSGQLDILVEVVLDEFHGYWLDITWSDVTIDPTTELTALFQQYLDDLFDATVTVADMTYLMDGFYVQYLKDNTEWYDQVTLLDVTILQALDDHLYVELQVDFDFAESHYREDYVRTYVDKVEVTEDGYLIPPINHYPEYRDHTFAEAQDLIQRMFDAYYDGTIDYEDFLMNEQSYEAIHFNDIVANPSLLFPAVEPAEVRLVVISNITGYYSLWFRYESETGQSHWMPPFYELDLGYEDGDHKVMFTYRYDWDDSIRDDLVASWHNDFSNAAIADDDVCGIVSGIGIDCDALRSAALSGTSNAVARTEEVLPGVYQPYLDLTVDGTTYSFQMNVSLHTTSPWGYQIASLEYQNPSVSYTIDMVQDRLDQMMQDHMDGTFDCASYFTGTALVSCNSASEPLFATDGTPVVSLEQWDDPLSFVVYPYSYNGEFDGYTQRFPVYQVTVDASGETLLFDTLTFFASPVTLDYEALVATFQADVLDGSLSNTAFCDRYMFPTYHAFHDWMPCATFRQVLIEAGDDAIYTFRFGPNPYGTTIPIVSIQVGDETYDFEPVIRYATSTAMYIERLWYILYEDASGITLDDVTYATMDFEAELLDETISSTTFCVTYPVSNDCVAWRDALLAATDTTISYTGGIQADGTSDYTMIIEADGGTTNLAFTMDASGDVPVIGTVTLVEDCVCDDTECDWTILVHTIANEALWQRFLHDYNDVDIDDATLASWYFNGNTNALLTARASRIGPLRLVDVQTNWLEGVFVDATVTLAVDQSDRIQLYHIQYVATTPSEDAYVISLTDLTTESSLTASQAATLFEAYLNDYLDYNVTSDTLVDTYFTTDPGAIFTERMAFLFAGGTIEFDQLTLMDGWFLARYTVIDDGVETTYEQALFAAANQTMTFGERRILGTVLRDTTEEEALDILTSMFDGLMNPTMTMQEVCETYFEGDETCPFDLESDPLDTTYAIHSITPDTTVVPTAYDIVYEKNVFGVTYQVSERFTVQIADDGSFRLLSLGGTVAPDSTIAFGLGDVDLVPYMAYIEQLFVDYFDNTIDTTTFCATHRYYDEYLEHIKAYVGIPEAERGRFYCEKYRDENFMIGSHLDIVNIEFNSLYRHYDGSLMVAFTVLSHGYYTIYQDIYDGEDYDYRIPIIVQANDLAPHGYQAQFDYLAYQTTHPLSQTDVEAFAAREIAFLSDPDNNGDAVCNRYGIFTPGHRCFLDQASVDGWQFLSYDIRIPGRYVSGSSTYMLSVDLRLTYEDPATGLRRSITIPLDAEVDYDGSINDYRIYDDPSDYRVTYSPQKNVLEYDTLLAQVNAFVQAYFDASLSSADFITQYQNGVDATYGELDTVRQQDLANATDPMVLDIALLPYTTYLSADEHYVYVFIQDGDVVHPAHLLYVEPDGATPGFFMMENNLIKSYLIGFVPSS